MLQYIKTPPFQNVVATGIATMTLNAGPTYEHLDFVLGGTFTKAMIALLTVKTNGRITYQITGSRLDTINQYKGLQATATILRLPFTEIKSRDRLGELMGAYASAAGLSNITLEVSIAGATAPTLDCYAGVSGPRTADNPLAQAICKLINYPVAYGAGGKQNWSFPAGQSGPAFLKRLHIFHTNLTAMEVKQNGIVIQEGTIASQQYDQQCNGKVVQASHYVVEFMSDWNTDESISPRSLQRLEFNPTLSGADTLNYYAEVIDPLGNL